MTNSIENKPVSKSSLAIAILQRTAGTTISQLVAVPSWLPRTTRVVLTGLKKKGCPVTGTNVKNTERVCSQVAR